MKQEKESRKLVQSKKILTILLGNAIYAFGVAYFLLPTGLITGGTTGIAIFIHHYTGMSIQVFVSCFNILMFVLGALVLHAAYSKREMEITTHFLNKL